MPPVQHMAAADPTFFHQSMKPQQYAIVAARRGLEIRRNSPAALYCDFMGCAHRASSEAGLVEHIFKHFQTAAGGLCTSCKQFCATAQDREAHQCSPTGHCCKSLRFPRESTLILVQQDMIPQAVNTTPPINPIHYSFQVNSAFSLQRHICFQLLTVTLLVRHTLASYSVFLLAKFLTQFLTLAPCLV